MWGQTTRKSQQGSSQQWGGRAEDFKNLPAAENKLKGKYQRRVSKGSFPVFHVESNSGYCREILNYEGRMEKRLSFFSTFFFCAVRLKAFIYFNSLRRLTFCVTISLIQTYYFVVLMKPFCVCVCVCVLMFLLQRKTWNSSISRFWDLVTDFLKLFLGKKCVFSPIGNSGISNYIWPINML